MTIAASSPKLDLLKIDGENLDAENSIKTVYLKTLSFSDSKVIRDMYAVLNFIESNNLEENAD